MATRIPVVVIPCHFENKDALCATSIKRLDEALHLDLMTDVLFILTGPVSYEQGSKRLSDLMEKYLCSRGVSLRRIVCIENGVGIFSEAQNAVVTIKKKLADCEKFFAISSDWYFLPGWRIWDHFASKNNLEVTTVEVENTGGTKTRFIYFVYGIVTWLAFALRLNRLMARIMTKLQSGRKENFKFNGCG